MGKVEKYRKIVQEVLTKYAADRSGQSQSEEIETQLLFDTANDHYQLLRVGWHKRTQTFLVIFHFDIRDGKIWLQQNASDFDIVSEIEKEGVPKSDIVLAFHSPQMRPFTGYAAM